MDAQVVEGTLDQRIAVLAHADHGIVDRAGLHAVGASRTQIGTRIRAGRLIPLHRGVYAVGHSRLTQRGWWLAAVRALGEGAVLSHAHAAALWNLRAPPGGPVHVTTGPGGRSRRAGLIVHRSRSLRAEHVTLHERIPVTSVARTLSDLAGTVEAAALARAVEAAESLRLLDVPSALAAAAGRPGAARLADAPRRRAGSHPQRLRGGDGRPLPATPDRAAADERRGARAPRRLPLAGAPRRRRARQLALPQHPCGVRARPGARRRPAGPRLRDPPLHLRAGDPPRVVGRLPAQAGTRVTFSAWIFFWAPVRRARGSGASAPRSSSASR